MVILGLTGSIAMGKSAAAAAFRTMGVPVHDADGTVHGLLGEGGGAVDPVAAAFPRTRIGDRIDRARLGQAVFEDAAALGRLEAVLHPLVRASQRRFLEAAARRGESLVVLDIPLLFETGGEGRCDAVAVVSAPSFLQAARALARPGMDRRRMTAILARQMPDAEKRRRAALVISTGLGRDFSRRAIRRIVIALRRQRGRCWSPAWDRPTTRKGGA